MRWFQWLAITVTGHPAFLLGSQAERKTRTAAVTSNTVYKTQLECQSLSGQYEGSRTNDARVCCLRCLSRQALAVDEAVRGLAVVQYNHRVRRVLFEAQTVHNGFPQT